MKDIKNKVHEGICIILIITCLVMIAVCSYNTSKEMKEKKKLDREEEWNVEFKDCTQSRSWGKGEWLDMVVE